MTQKMRLTPVVLALTAIGGLATIAAVGAGAAGFDRASESFSHTYPLAADGRVSLANVSGNIRITGWDRNEVRLEAVKHADADEDLQAITIAIDARPDAVEIETKYPHHFFDDHHSGRVDYTLSVPNRARIDSIKLVSGDLRLEGLTGDVDASSVSGEIRAEGLTGAVHLSGVSGTIEASFDRDPGRRVSLSTVSGSIVLGLMPDANANVSAETVSGGIHSDLPIEVNQHQWVGQSLHGTLGNGEGQIDLHTVSGSIELRRASAVSN
jgi:Putative adhesin